MKNILGKIINDYIVDELHDNFMLFEDDITELMKRAYNQALEDVSSEAWWDGDDYILEKESINKLKIK